ncbi:hypothetical protein [Cohnella cholangitidis]|nr:hypothetical protein [Cohnella cholangitidis]
MYTLSLRYLEISGLPDPVSPDVWLLAVGFALGDLTSLRCHCYRKQR